MAEQKKAAPITIRVNIAVNDVRPLAVSPDETFRELIKRIGAMIKEPAKQLPEFTANFANKDVPDLDVTLGSAGVRDNSLVVLRRKFICVNGPSTAPCPGDLRKVKTLSDGKTGLQATIYICQTCVAGRDKGGRWKECKDDDIGVLQCSACKCTRMVLLGEVLRPSSYKCLNCLLGEKIHDEMVKSAENVAEAPEPMTALPGQDLPATRDALSEGDKKALAQTEAELKAELDALVGMNDLKEFFLGKLKLHKDRLAEGKKLLQLARPAHIAFQGNAGTGKSSAARLLSKYGHRIGLCKSPVYKEVQANKDFIGAVVGATESNVNQAVAAAKDGILFVDEAYYLAENGMYNKAALDTLFGHLGDNDKEPTAVIVFAGYKSRMEALWKSNEGFDRRFKKVDLPDYSPEDLVKIWRIKIKAKGQKVDPPGWDEKHLAALFNSALTPEYRSKNNAGMIDTLYNEVDKARSERFTAEDFKQNPQLRSVLPEDLIVTAVQKLGKSS